MRGSERHGRQAFEFDYGLDARGIERGRFVGNPDEQ
jgi:hypothetical protein